jgi:hypothetical protein
MWGFKPPSKSFLEREPEKGLFLYPMKKEETKILKNVTIRLWRNSDIFLKKLEFWLNLDQKFFERLDMGEFVFCMVN